MFILSTCVVVELLIQEIECGKRVCFASIVLELESDSGDKDPIKGLHTLRNLQQSDDNLRYGSISPFYGSHSN